MAIFRRRPGRGAQVPEPAEATGAGGPYDAKVAPHAHAELDLGSLRLPDIDGVALSLRPGSADAAPTSVVVHAGEAAMELAVFAAPTSQPLWDEVRGRLVDDGATVEAVSGRFGPTVRTLGRSKVIGIDGPRWFLRVVVAPDDETRDDELGTPAGLGDSPTGSALLDEVLTGLVVVRGTAAAPPRQPLPLHLPGAEDPSPAQAVAAAANADLARRPAGSATTEAHPPVHELTPPFTAGLSRNLSTWG